MGNVARFGVRGRLLLAFFAISAFAVLAAVTAMYSLFQINAVLERITERRIPSALTSLQLSRQAEELVAAAPALLALTDEQQRLEVAAGVEAQINRLQQLLEDLKRQEIDPAALDSIAPAVDWLSLNLISLDTVVANRLAFGERMTEQLGRVAELLDHTQRLTSPWTTMMDAKIAELRSALAGPSPSLADRQAMVGDLAETIASLWILQRIESDASEINDLLHRVAIANDTQTLDKLMVPIELSLASMEALAAEAVPELRPKLIAQVDAFRDLAFGSGSVPTAREFELGVQTDAERLLRESGKASRQLTAAVDRLVGGIDNDMSIANQEAMATRRLSTGILIGVVVLSLLSSILIVWLYVGRNLIARLRELSGSMLAIAQGNLATPIPTGGSDEIGRMADALTVFRNTAIEVKETNLREVHEARSRLSDAIDSISEGFILYDAEDRLVLCNKRYREIYAAIADVAKPGTPFESVARAAAERNLIVGAADDPEPWLKRRLERHRNPQAPHLQRFTDGRWIQVDERKTEAGGTVAVFMEITELKRQEQELEEISTQLRTALDSMSGGIFMVDKDLQFQVVNEKFRSFYQLPEDVVKKGRSLTEVIRIRAERGDYGAGDPETLIEERIRGYRNRAVMRYEDHVPGGRVIEALRAPIDDGGTVVVVHDITEFKRQAQELEEKSTQLRAALDSMSGAIFMVDKDLTIQVVNDNCRLFYDLPKHLLQKGRSLTEVIRIRAERGDYGPGDPEALIEERIRGYRTRDVMRYDDHVFGGRVIEARRAPTEGGGTVVVAHDITERKRFEQEILKARDAAQAATLAKSTFLANMSHELRTPMNAIIGFARLVMRNSRDVLPPKQYDNLGKIVISADHLLGLINNILDLSKIEAGRVDVHATEFNVEGVVDQCLRTVEHLEKGDRLQFVKEIAPDLPAIVSDQDKLRQIIINLLSNAVKFTEKGSVTVRAGANDDAIVLSVIDTGIGIPAEELDRIFEEFHQVDGSSTRSHGGTGLGLTITRHLIRLLGGEITVDSEVGVGSTFTVTLPLCWRAKTAPTDELPSWLRGLEVPS